MSSAPTGSCAPSLSLIEAAIRRASGTPRRWMPTSTSPAVPACFSTISWETRMTARRISSGVMMRRPLTRSLPASRGPPPARGPCSKVGAECSGPPLAQDLQVCGRLGLDLAECGAGPAKHLQLAVVPVLAGRADPRQPVEGDREAAQGRLTGQWLVGLDGGGRRLDHDEVQAAVGRAGMLAHPDREPDPVWVELRHEILEMAPDDGRRVPGRPADRRNLGGRSGAARTRVGGGVDPAVQHELAVAELPGHAVGRAQGPRPEGHEARLRIDDRHPDIGLRELRRGAGRGVEEEGRSSAPERLALSVAIAAVAVAVIATA